MTSTATDNGPAINTQDHLKALTFQRLHPRTYLERFLQEDVRPDGRAFGGWRDVSMNVGEQRQIFCPTILLCSSIIQVLYPRQMALPSSDSEIRLLFVE